MEQHPRQGGETYGLDETPRWPRYIGSLALDAWLARVAAFETTQPPSVELFIAQYPGENEDQTASEPRGNDSFQLPLHLQWGDRTVPGDMHEKPLTPEDAAATRRIFATSVDVLSGRTALFALYEQLEPKVYAAMETRLRTGTRLPYHARLRSVHGQYPAKGIIEACGIVEYGRTSQALVTRLERKRRRWLGTVLRMV